MGNDAKMYQAANLGAQRPPDVKGILCRYQLQGQMSLSGNSFTGERIQRL